MINRYRSKTSIEPTFRRSQPAGLFHRAFKELAGGVFTVHVEARHLKGHPSRFSKPTTGVGGHCVRRRPRLQGGRVVNPETLPAGSWQTSIQARSSEFGTGRKVLYSRLLSRPLSVSSLRQRTLHYRILPLRAVCT